MSSDRFPLGIMLRHTFQGHERTITQVAWSPGGHILASSSNDQTVRLWDTQVGQNYPLIKEHSDSVNSITWSPDGKRLASVKDGRQIYIWNTHDGAQITEFEKNSSQITCVAWSLDEDILAFGLFDQNIQLLDVKQKNYFQTLIGHSAPVIAIAWSPDGRTLASASRDQTLRLWDALQGSSRQTLIGHSAPVIAIAWSPDGRTLASGSTDDTIRLWDSYTGQQMRILEEHTDWVTSVSFSYDGLLLASKSRDGTVRLWRTDIWEVVAIIDEPASGGQASGLAFHPNAPILATLGEEDATLGEENTVIRLWDLDVGTLLGMEQVRPVSHYTNAKVVLVGDSGVGKSGLGLVLTDHSFVPTESTHGRHVWTFDSREVALDDGKKEIREILLWDLAGQSGYRLIHQLYLREVIVALIVIDTHRETDPFAGVNHWDRALRLAQYARHNSIPLKKLLVVARIDRGGIRASRARITSFVKELNFDGYIETSAKERWGIAELAQMIRDAVDWNALPKVSSTTLFQDIKGFLLAEKGGGRVLSTSDDLYRTFLKSVKKQHKVKDLQVQFETCIGQIESQGLIRQLSFGNLVLLQPELIDAYASALVNAVKDEPDGLGSIAEENVRSGHFPISQDERLANKEQEKLLLIAMIEDLLRNEIALRERANDGPYLVFPSQSTRENPDLPDPEEKSTIFRFEGPVQNIYATLAVRLAHSGLFKIKDLWRNAVTYKTKMGDMCGMFLHDFGEGRAELTLFFDAAVSRETRLHFEEYIQAHLQRRALPETLKRQRILLCSSCGEQFLDAQIIRRQQLGFTEITCSICDTKVSLFSEDEQFTKKALAVVSEMDRSADVQREREVIASTNQNKWIVDQLEQTDLIDVTNNDFNSLDVSSELMNKGAQVPNPYNDLISIRSPDKFFGRRILLSRIYTELVSKQCVSLIGPPQVGKSSVLHCLRFPELQREFAQSLHDYIFVLIDLREYLQKTSEDFFEAVSIKILAQAYERLNRVHESTEGADEFSALLNEIQTQGFYTVLLMDAFDSVTRNPHFDLDFFSFLRAQATLGKISYVTASIVPLHQIFYHSAEESPFFNIFRTHRVGPLALEEARELTLQPSQRAGLPFTPDEIDWVLKLAGRHPFFIQQVCHYLFEEKSHQSGDLVDRKRIKRLAYEELAPHFNDTWERLPQAEQEQLKHEARMATMPQRALPELSESSLFRLFVRDKFKIHLFHMTKEELEKVLDKIDDIRALGESELRHMGTVSMRMQQNTFSAVERGMIVRDVLNEAFERMHGNGVRRDGAPEWRLYNILYYRYFKHHLKNDQISARLEFSSTRQFFRERTRATEALLNILFEMEAANLGKDEDY